MKFCTAVRPDLRQVFSYYGDSPRDGRILGVNRASYDGICFLLKHLCYIWRVFNCTCLLAYLLNFPVGEITARRPSSSVCVHAFYSARVTDDMEQFLREAAT